MSKMKDWMIEYDETVYDTTPDSNEVFVLGAGFSKAVTPSIPTMPELTEKLKERGLLRGYLSGVTDFEILLNSLSIRHPWLTEAEYLRSRALYLEIARAVTDVLRHCFGRLEDENRSTLCSIHEKLGKGKLIKKSLLEIEVRYWV